MLNSLSLDFISASAALLGEGGCFEEIGKRGVWSHERSASSCDTRLHLSVLAVDEDLTNQPSWMQSHASQQEPVEVDSPFNDPSVAAANDPNEPAWSQQQHVEDANSATAQVGQSSAEAKNMGTGDSNPFQDSLL